MSTTLNIEGKKMMRSENMRRKTAIKKVSAKFNAIFWFMSLRLVAFTVLTAQHGVGLLKISLLIYLSHEQYYSFS